MQSTLRTFVVWSWLRPEINLSLLAPLHLFTSLNLCTHKHGVSREPSYIELWVQRQRMQLLSSSRIQIKAINLVSPTANQQQRTLYTVALYIWSINLLPTLSFRIDAHLHNDLRRTTTQTNLNNIALWMGVANKVVIQIDLENCGLRSVLVYVRIVL